MKLYTENQVKKMLEVCRDSDLYEHILTFEDILKSQTPIELPSDEEIYKRAFQQWGDYSKTSHQNAYSEGAKWMRNKIGGNDDQQ